MAKKKAGTRKPRSQQQQFEGDGFPKRPPAAVTRARDEYVQAKRDQATASLHKGECEQKLIELMKKHGIDRIKLEEENKFIEISAPEKVNIKTVPKDQRDAREASE